MEALKPFDASVSNQRERANALRSGITEHCGDQPPALNRFFWKSGSAVFLDLVAIILNGCRRVRIQHRSRYIGEMAIVAARVGREPCRIDLFQAGNSRVTFSTARWLLKRRLLMSVQQSRGGMQ
jgi:hypothetical protein